MFNQKSSTMLKKILLFAIAGVLFYSCAQQPKDVQETSEIIESFTIAELYENAVELEGSDVHFEGVIVHACRHSGDKIRVAMDDDEQTSVFVMLGEFSDQIGVEDEGKDISIIGKLVVLDKEEYDAEKRHDECEEEHEHDEDCDHDEKAEEHMHDEDCDHDEKAEEHVHDEDCDHEEKAEEHVHDHDCEHEEEVEEQQKDQVKFIIELVSFEWI